MTVAGGLEGADPADLVGLREILALADPEGTLAAIGMERIEIGTDALSLLPEVVSEPPAVRVSCSPMDATPTRRADGNPKAEAERMLAGRFEVRHAVFVEFVEGRTQLHADEGALAEVESAVAWADCVVTVGSGTVTDICKEARACASPLIVVQTAASVNAFSDNVSVLLKSGTKRTVPSCWPDALLVDLSTLADASPAKNLSGFGDIISMWDAPADWYLDSGVGMPIAIQRGAGELPLRLWELPRPKDPEGSG